MVGFCCGASQRAVVTVYDERVELFSFAFLRVLGGHKKSTTKITKVHEGISVTTG
jgi:hypothetical protein